MVSQQTLPVSQQASPHQSRPEGPSSLKLTQFLPYRMVNLAKRISDALATIYEKEFNLSVPEWRVLAQLGEHKQLSAKQIISLSTMDKSKVSRAVKLLQDKHLLDKEKDSNDHRICYLSLSLDGQQLYQSICPKALAWEADLLKALDASEYRDLMRIFDKLENRLTDNLSSQDSP